MTARPYHGPHVVLTPEEARRVYGWADNAAGSVRSPDHMTVAIRAKCEAAINARPTPTRGTTT